MNAPFNLCTLVLAAGSSQRFGTDKRRYLLDGRPLLQRTLALALTLPQPCLVVLRRADQQQLAQLLGDYSGEPRLQACYANAADQGMGHSLAFGIARLVRCDGVIIMLADMPWLEPGTLQYLAARFDGKHILVPRFQRQRGHPVVFPASCFGELMSLTGDQGGREILARHSELVIEIDLPDHGIINDLDYPIRSPVDTITNPQ